MVCFQKSREKVREEKRKVVGSNKAASSGGDGQEDDASVNSLLTSTLWEDWTDHQS